MIWRELKRRRVLRTCALYLFALWVLIQACDVLIPLLGYELPEAPRYLLYGGVALFPLVVLAAWFIQLTPRGVQRTDAFSERRLLENIPPINDRRAHEGVNLSRGGGYDWVLTCESGPLQGLRYGIAKPLLIGRAKDSDLALVSAHVSRHHARLTPREDGSLLLEDLGSANGTRVNGALVQVPRILQAGDLLTIKDIQFRVSESFARSQGPGSATEQDTVIASAQRPVQAVVERAESVEGVERAESDNG